MVDRDIQKNNAIKRVSLKINYYVVIAIVGLGIIDLVYALYFFDGSYFDIKDGFYMAGIAGCGIASVSVAKKYDNSVLGRAYLFLGLSFFSWFIADVGYYSQQFVLNIDPWPSIFDIGILGIYVFSIFHLYINIRLFKPKWTTPMKATLVLIPVIAVSIFTIIAYDAWKESDTLAFDLAYSNLFVVGASLTLAFAIIGASIFRESALKETWLLLALGIFLWAIADAVFTYLETIEEFTHNHPINTLWMVSFMVIIYALYKHHKAL